MIANCAKDSVGHQSPRDSTIDHDTRHSTPPSPSTHDDGEDLHDSDPSYSDEDEEEQGDPTFKFPKPLSGPQLTVTPARSDRPVGVSSSQLRSQSLYSSRKRGAVTDEDGNVGSTKRARRHSRDNGCPTPAQQDQEMEDAIDQPAVGPDNAEADAFEDRRKSLVVKLKIPQDRTAERRQSDVVDRTAEPSSSRQNQRVEPFSDSMQSSATISGAEAQNAEAPSSSGDADDDTRREEIAEATVRKATGALATSNIHHPPPGYRSEDGKVSPTEAFDSLNHDQEIPRQFLGAPAPVAVMLVDAPAAPPVTADPVRTSTPTTSSRGALVRKGSNRVEKGKATQRESNPGPTNQTRSDNRISAETVQALKEGIAAFRQSEGALDDRRSISTPHSSSTGQAFHGTHGITDKNPEQTAVAGPSRQRLSTPTTAAQDVHGRTSDTPASKTAEEPHPTKAVSGYSSMITNPLARPEVFAPRRESKASIERVFPQNGEDAGVGTAAPRTGPLTKSVATSVDTEAVQPTTAGANLPSAEQSNFPRARATPTLQEPATTTSDVAPSVARDAVLPAEGSILEVPAQGAVTAAERSAAPSQTPPAAPNPQPPAAPADGKPGTASVNAQHLNGQVQPTVEAAASASQDAKPQAVSSNLATGKIILVDWILKGDDSATVSRITQYTPDLMDALEQDTPNEFKDKKLTGIRLRKATMTAREVLERYGESIAPSAVKQCARFLMSEALGEDATVERTWQKAVVVMRD